MLNSPTYEVKGRAAYTKHLHPALSLGYFPSFRWMNRASRAYLSPFEDLGAQSFVEQRPLNLLKTPKTFGQRTGTCTKLVMCERVL